MKTKNVRRGVAALVSGITVIGLAAVAAAPAGAKTPKSYLGVQEALDISVTSFTETFVVPTYRCTKAEQVDAYADTFDEAPASPNTFTGGYVDLACGKHNAPTPLSTLEVDGVYESPTLAIATGDTVEISFSCGDTGSLATIADVTTSQSVQDSSATPSDCNGVFAGNIGVTPKSGKGVSPLPKFGSINFTTVELNSEPLGTFDPTSVNYYESKKNQIVVGPMAAGGTSFVNTQES